jgi:hypothetical protein
MGSVPAAVAKMGYAELLATVGVQSSTMQAERMACSQVVARTPQSAVLAAVVRIAGQCYLCYL